MSLAALETTVNSAFDAREGISTATKGEVRDAVDHALDLLDKGEARVAEREAERQVEGQSVAEEGGAAVVPPQRHGPDRRRPRQGVVVGQGALEVRGLGREPLSRRRLSRRARRDRAPLGLHRPQRRADAVLRQSRRLCR